MSRVKKYPNLKPAKKGEVRNPAGRPALPVELKQARKARRVDIELKLEKFMELPYSELLEINKSLKASVFERILAAVIINGIKQGDQTRLQFILDNWVGPLPKKIEGEFDFGHKSIVKQLEEEE